MKITTLYCDICGAEMPQRGWEDAPYPIYINTHCSCQNAMAEFGGGHQENIFNPQEVCQECQRAVSNAVAGIVSQRKAANPKA